jgi:regulator of nucleoside diphosphate kinase
MMAALPRLRGKPPIVLSHEEADILYDLALKWRQRHPFSARLLLDELERARTVPEADLPDDVVTMGSRVDFLDRARGEKHAVQLVYPAAADMTQGRVSVMTPIGAGLIGMRRGREIDWPDRHGEWRRLKIVAVVQPARQERAA